MEKELLPGWTTGNCIGQGSFGKVYEIHREVYGVREQAALKVLYIPQDPSQIDTLRAEGLDDESITTQFDKQAKDIVQEYQLMMGLKNSPYIVHCQDLKVERRGLGSAIFLRMELLVPLIQALEQGQGKTEESILRLGSNLCAALETCREQNILHRDVKPQNIFLAPDGSFKLGDFGIARTAEAGGHATVGVGTHNFMAPEVLFGRSYDSRADIYSLGLVLYWLLNHYRGPFLPLPPAVITSENQETARARRFGGEALPAPAQGSRELQAIVQKACAFDPEQRYATASEMKKDLDALAAGKADQVAARLPQPEKKAGKRKWLLPTVAAGVLAVAAGGWALASAKAPEAAPQVTTAPVVETGPKELTFRDPLVEQAVREVLGKYSGPLTDRDCLSVFALELDGAEGTEEGQLQSLEDLQYLPTLVSLNLHNCQTLSDLSPVKNCKNLQTLSLWNVPAENLEFLEGLPKLQDLTLYECGTEDYTALTKLPLLTGLSLYSPYRSPAAEEESRLQSADSMRLGSSYVIIREIGESAAEETLPQSRGEAPIPTLDDVLRQLPQLDYLRVNTCQIEALSVLLELPELTVLELSGVTGIDTQVLGQMTQLTTLAISRDYDTEDSLALNLAIAEMLGREEETVGLEDLSFLPNLTNLRDLSLACVNDPQQLTYVKQMTSLKRLRMSSCGALDEDRENTALREALPNCSITIN